MASPAVEILRSGMFPSVSVVYSIIALKLLLIEGHAGSIPATDQAPDASILTPNAIAGVLHCMHFDRGPYGDISSPAPQRLHTDHHSCISCFS
jgi:hypothetical protein